MGAIIVPPKTYGEKSAGWDADADLFHSGNCRLITTLAARRWSICLRLESQLRGNRGIICSLIVSAVDLPAAQKGKA